MKKESKITMNNCEHELMMIFLYVKLALI